MKKILCLALLVGFAYSDTGNDFLKDYPFGKKWDEMTTLEQAMEVSYFSKITYFLSGNNRTLGMMRYEGVIDSSVVKQYSFKNRLCGITLPQAIRIIKKWCDENPDKTDMDFGMIVYIVFTSLPIRDCK